MAEQIIGKERPINSPLKSVITAMREPENPVKWAYTKLLRENDKTKRTYEVNPYAEVYRFRDNLYGIYTQSLDGMGDPWSYLIKGPQRAMLIDTGFGVGDLKGLVKEIVGDMPVIVANTHSHFDHAYGNFQFDKVYCHEYEAPLLKSKMNPHIWDYLFDENGKGKWADFDRNDIVPYREYEIAAVPDGHLFDLGEGYEIELIFLPGHSPGHAAYLDKRNRILFAGDDACYGNLGVGSAGNDTPYGQYCTVEALYKELVKLVKRIDEFDGIFPGHAIVDIGSIMMVNIMETCKAVLDNPEEYDEKREMNFFGESFVQYCKHLYLYGYLTYGRDSVYMDRKPISGIQV